MTAPADREEHSRLMPIPGSAASAANPGGPDNRTYTTWTIKHYTAFERGMEARKAGKSDTDCPYRSEIMVAFWLAGFNSPSAIAAMVKP